MSVCGNKSDLYETEAVSEEEAREFANANGAVFHLTSAHDNTGINELFYELGGKYLDPSFQAAVKATKEDKSEGPVAGNSPVRITQENTKNEPAKKKKKCC